MVLLTCPLGNVQDRLSGDHRRIEMIRVPFHLRESLKVERHDLRGLAETTGLTQNTAWEGVVQPIYPERLPRFDIGPWATWAWIKDSSASPRASA